MGREARPRTTCAAGRRWQHTQGVARRAEELCRAVRRPDRDVLVAAAWLHDVGYASGLAQVGFHPLDGGRHLRSLGEERLACLVAHHTAADEEAALRGLAEEVADFPVDEGDVATVLAICDLTVGPSGEPMTPGERLAELESRYGPDDLVTMAVRRAWPRLMEQVALVERRLQELRQPT